MTMAAATRVPLPSVSIFLPHSTSSVRSARRRLSADLLRRGIPDEVIADAALVVSEMISNALKHARPLESGQIRISWDASSTCVELQVSDGGGPTRPYLQPPSLTSVGGRGLAIVATLCTEWGVRQEADATTVWATLAAGRPLATPQQAWAQGPVSAPGSG
jgi:anti-sigma regulatory factor (Ser/Thr protein kinase)